MNKNDTFKVKIYHKCDGIRAIFTKFQYSFITCNYFYYDVWNFSMGATLKINLISNPSPRLRKDMHGRVRGFKYIGIFIMAFKLRVRTCQLLTRYTTCNCIIVGDDCSAFCACSSSAAVAAFFGHYITLASFLGRARQSVELLWQKYKVDRNW